jgi:hypothetical protein
MSDPKRVAFDRERVAVSTTPVGLTASKFLNLSAVGTPNIERASAVQIEVISNAIYYTLTPGATPGAGEGKSASAGDVFTLTAYEEIANFSAVRNGASDSALEVTYLR